MTSHLDCAPVLVSIGPPVEEPLNGEVHLLDALLQGPFRHLGYPLPHLLTTQLKVLRNVVDDLGTVVGSTLTPSSERVGGREKYPLISSFP